MSSTTVRITDKTCRALRELAASSGETMQAVLDKAIEAYRRQRFFAEMDAGYAAWQNDPAAWQAEQEERCLWEQTLMDGLDPGEIWTSGLMSRSAATASAETRPAR